jgi:hypothetical protein
MALLRWLKSKPKQAAPSEPVETEAIRLQELPARAPGKIKIRLATILESLPTHLRTQVTQQVPDAELQLPLSEILPQLATGKIAVRAPTFRTGLPETARSAFDALDPGLKIPIPIRAIFSQLPPGTLSRPLDQQPEENPQKIETPFSAQVEEDSQRFDATGKPLAPPSKSVSQPEGSGVNVWTKNPALVKELQALLMTDEALDYPKVLNQLNQLPGLTSCQLNRDDGRKLAGGARDAKQEAAISAIVPNLFKTLDSHTQEMGLEPLETVTFTCGKDQLSAFVQDHLCLTVLHDNRPFRPGIREKIQAVVRHLARIEAA